jgi:hypothetical protein
MSGTEITILKIFLPKNLAKILAFFAQTTASFCKILIIALVNEKNAKFSPKMAQIAENCDHDIDPWTKLTIFQDKLGRLLLKYFFAFIKRG